jgi:hypothetical protein
MTDYPDNMILHKLAGLHKQATEERSHYYTGSVIEDSIKHITQLQAKLSEAEKLIAQQSKIIENYHAMKESEINNQQGE